jgi:hypothetical protein
VNSITRTYPQRVDGRYYADNNCSALENGPANRRYVELGSSTWSDTKTSAANPKWRDQVRSHVSATTHRDTDVKTSRGGYGTAMVEWYFGSSPSNLFPRFASQSGRLWIIGPPSTNPSSTTANNQAIGKFWKRAKDAQTAFRGLTALGELRETLQMIRRPGQGIRRGLDDYLKSVKKRSRRAKKSSLDRIVSETWLENVFGWQPLISDIKSAGDALNRRLNRFAGNYTNISAKGEEKTVSYGAQFTRSDFAIRHVYRYMTTSTVSSRWYGQVRSVAPNPMQADATLFGTNFREIVPTAWELLPWSFLVDYFTNIGDVLDAWSLRQSDIAWCSNTIKKTVEQTFAYHYLDLAYTDTMPLSYPVGITGSVSISPPAGKRVLTDRSPKDPILPSIRWEIPGLGTKWINMSALLAAKNRTRRQLFS